MKNILLSLSLIFLISACDYSVESANAHSNPALTASQYINYSENTHRAELAAYIGVDPKRTEWCAAFVNAVLTESGIANNALHQHPYAARSFLDWGTVVETPIPGDLIIFPRGNISWQGHVGFYLSTAIINNTEYYYILGGNQSNKVSIDLYRATRALGIRRSIL